MLYLNAKRNAPVLKPSKKSNKKELEEAFQRLNQIPDEHMVESLAFTSSKQDSAFLAKHKQYLRLHKNKQHPGGIQTVPHILDAAHISFIRTWAFLLTNMIRVVTFPSLAAFSTTSLHRRW